MEWRNNLFQGSDKLRGLSGGVGSAVALDDRNSFYNFRLRRHYTDEEIASAPERVWFTNDDPEARTGLGPHIAEALAEGQRFSDVLVILSEDDWYEVESDPSLAERIIGKARSSYEAFLAKAGVPHTSRPLGVWLVGDGTEAIGGQSFGLVEGEFITGITPNLYRQPGPGSEAIISVLAYLPGHTDDYEEVGRLYDDQVVFTIGNHWLDNFRNPLLREAALYRIQREDDGAFFHIINPDLQDRYQLTSTDQDGESVITLATWSGEPLAYLVLAVIEAPIEMPSHGIELLPLEIEEGPEPSSITGSEPELFAPMALEPAPMPASSLRGPGSKTIIPDAQTERIFTLQERGALLQKVHFSGFMLGYDVYLGPRGELGTVVHQPAASFQVRKSTVSMLANADNVSMNGEPIPRGESRLIEGDSVIQVGNQRLEYRDLRGVPIEGWPYVGEIRRPAASTYMLWGKEYSIGRSRDCRVVLPDEPRNDNIVWKPKVVEGAVIKSKTGDIAKSRFYTDSIMVASDHAAIDLTHGGPEVVCHARNCYTFVRRNEDVLTLFPTESGEGPVRLPLEPGDEVMVGNCLFHVGFAPTGELAGATGSVPSLHRENREPAAPARSATDSLVDAISAPDFGNEPPPVRFEAPSTRRSGTLPDVEDELSLAPVPAVERPLDDARSSGSRPRPDTDDLAPDDAPAPPSMSKRPAAPAPPQPAKAAPAPAPKAAPAPTPAPAPAPVAAVLGGVAIVDDRDAQFELGRPARLVLVGWAINGTVTLGNHAGTDLVLPENRIEAGQTFIARSYLTLKIRGRRSSAEDVSASEIRVDGGAPSASYDSLEGRTISVIRRDADGEEDFCVDLRVLDDASLPDPRARLVSLDTGEPLAVALTARGFPVRAPRTLTLGSLTVTVTFDGSRLVLDDYLDTYRSGGGFRPFFVAHGQGRFTTAPEDGASIELSPGDRIVVDGAVYRFDVA